MLSVGLQSLPDATPPSLRLVWDRSLTGMPERQDQGSPQEGRTGRPVADAVKAGRRQVGGPQIDRESTREPAILRRRLVRSTTAMAKVDSPAESPHKPQSPSGGSVVPTAGLPPSKRPSPSPGCAEPWMSSHFLLSSLDQIRTVIA
jgi:hypothetical protein